MGNKQSNDANDEPELEQVKSQHVKDILKIRSIQTLFSTFYLSIQETLSRFSQLKLQADFFQMKNIDLCQALKGTVFKTQLIKLCDIKQIIKNIEIGFSSLQCDNCDQYASIACEGNQETPYKLFCEGHFEVLGSHFKSSINLIHDLRYNTIMLNELERYIIRLQERIEYFSIENDNKNPFLYQKIKGLIEDNFGELSTSLENLASKCSRINQLNTKMVSSNSKMKYEYLSFIKDDCDKCRNKIFMILSMIPEVCEKIETDSLVQVIVDSNQGVQFVEETKENFTSSIPDHIYGKEYQFVHIPTQSLIQFKEFENKIKTNCKIIETCIERFKQMMDTANSLNKMLEDKLDETEKKIIKEREKILKDLKLKDIEYYIKEFKGLKKFPTVFKKTREVESKLGQHTYPHQLDSSRPLKVNKGTLTNGNKYIYFGQLEEGTNKWDGVGTIVYSDGRIYEGCCKNDKANGFGRYIYKNGQYYIGEFKDGSRHGQGTYWYEDGRKYVGEYENNKRNGKGMEYTADGQIFMEGEWVDGQYVGKG